MGREYGGGSLFRSERAKWRAAYKLYACSMLISIFLIYYYRATHIPEFEGRWAWLGLFGAEFWFGFYWILTQSVRWNPIFHYTHKDKLTQRFGTAVPAVDIFVCTADPKAEPPSMVISTVLSVMAYDYPPEKLSVYLSDDAGSNVTFYALWEASYFAKHWLPYCKNFNVEPRSPAAYFAKNCEPCNQIEWSNMKKLYEEMESRINTVVDLGSIPEELKKQKGFSKWNAEMTKQNHQSIVQILIDGKDQKSLDLEGKPMPTLVYMAREKNPQYHHNFKAGAMNSLIRVSSAISNGPIILNVDCDMYSNDPESIKDAICFFLDEHGNDICYVQHPQHFANTSKNDLYANAFKVIMELELSGFNNWAGPLYIGTGCFHRRESLCGRKYSTDYTEDWNKCSERKEGETVSNLEERAERLATCTYEQNTLWGKEMGLQYGCPVEDVITGLSIQCRGWRSVYFNPRKSAFLGVTPTTLEQTLVQHKRWSEGHIQIFLSKYSSFIQGHGKLNIAHQMGYCIYNAWALNSFPTLCYVVIPPLCLLNGISLFPKISTPWFIPFAYIITAKNIYSLVESLQCGDTLLGWWYVQRMWVFKRLTSYLYGTIDTILKLFGLSEMAFVISTKVADEDVMKRYQQEIMEFGSSSSMFIIISTAAMLNLICLAGGITRLIMDAAVMDLGPYFLQIVLCCVLICINFPVYEGMFLRKDNGRIPEYVTFISLGIAILTCLLPIV